MTNSFKSAFEQKWDEIKYRFNVFKNYTIKKSFVIYAIEIPGHIYDFFKNEVFYAVFKAEKNFDILPKIARRMIFFAVISVLAAGMAYGVYRLVPSYDQRAAGFFDRATQFYSSGMYPEAVIEYKNALLYIPGNAEAHYKLAHAFIYLSRLKEAAGELFRCFQIDPQREDALTKFNAVNRLLEDLGKKKIKEDTPLKRGARLIRGRTLMAKVLVYAGDNNSASEEAKKLYDDAPDSPDLNIIMGDISLSNNDTANANNYYLKALAVDKNSFEAHYKMGALLAYQNKIDKALDEFIKASEISPDNPLVYAAIGDCCARLNQYDKAVEYYKKAYGLNNRFIKAAECISNILISQGRITEATSYINELCKISPDAPTSLLYKAVALFSTNKTEEAFLNIRKSIKIKNDSFQAHYIYARMLAAVGMLREAKEEYIATINLSPNILEPHMELFDICVKLNDLDKAQVEAARARAIAADDIRTIAAQGMSHLLMNEYDAAGECFDVIVKKYPAKPDGYFFLGMLAQSKGETESAEKMFISAFKRDINCVNAAENSKAGTLCERMLGMNPRGAAVYEILGNVFTALNRGGDAKAFYEKALGLNPALLPARAGLAKLYLSKNMSGEAQTQYEEILKTSPDNRQAVLGIASIYQGKGDNDKAVQYYEQALKLGFDCELADNLALSYLKDGKNSDRALELAVMAETASSNAPEAVDTTGLILLKKEKYDQAADKFRKCVGQKSDEPVYKYHLGLALYKIGALSAACKYFKAALSLSDSFDGAVESKKLINELRAKGIE